MADIQSLWAEQDLIYNRQDQQWCITCDIWQGIPCITIGKWQTPKACELNKINMVHYMWYLARKINDSLHYNWKVADTQSLLTEQDLIYNKQAQQWCITCNIWQSIWKKILGVTRIILNNGKSHGVSLLLTKPVLFAAGLSESVCSSQHVLKYPWVMSEVLKLKASEILCSEIY